LLDQFSVAKSPVIHQNNVFAGHKEREARMVSVPGNKVVFLAAVLGALLALAGLGILVFRSIDKSQSNYATLAITATASIGIGLVLWFVPKLQLTGITFDKSQDRFDSENEARKSLAQLLGGMAFLATFYVTWSSFSVERDKASTEEFTKAVEQISKQEIAVRIGGAYALERLSRSSPRDYDNVISVLTEALRNGEQTNFDKRTNDRPLIVPRADDDMQVMAQILGRRLVLSTSHETALNLSNADLRGVRGRDGHFEWANFGDADLRSAYFNGTHLAHASFIGSTGTVIPVPDAALASENKAAIEQATKLPSQPCTTPNIFTSQLRSISFPDADLTGALFDSARFEGASFNHANLVGASFKYALLQRAKFTGADLKGVDFKGAHLEGADFTGAIDFSPSQLATAITDNCTRLH
jgi:uncharacterized protein YjbI with pentapeptide repeats